jgi:hypothetical protein
MSKHLTRRDFVRATALAVAAPVVISTPVISTGETHPATCRTRS